MFNALFFLAFFSALWSGDESIDIQEQYHYRTQQYPTNDYQKILVFSPSRTGSTLVFNVLKFLFENSDCLDENAWIGGKKFIVGKTHHLGYFEPSCMIFCTIRNPEDTCFSRYRVMNPGKFKKLNQKALDIAVRDYITQMHWVQSLVKGNLPNVVLLKYEEFDSNLNFIFDEVENKLGIEISEFDKTLMEEAFSKKNVAKSTKKLNEFKNYDGVTLFHGAHIEGDEFTKEQKEFVYEEIRKRLSGKCDFLKQFGYTLRDPSMNIDQQDETR